MDHWLGELLKYLKDPVVIVLVGVIAVLCKLLLIMTKNMTGAIDKIGSCNVLLAELTTLVKSFVYRGRVGG